jgi:hypothetical protein
VRLRYKCTVRLKAIGTFRPRRTRFAVPDEVLNRYELRSKMEYALQLESSSCDRAVHFDLRPLSFADEGHRSINFGSQNP